MPKISDYFKPLGTLIDETEADLARCVWISVILLAVNDARGKGCNAHDRASAVAWLEARGGIRSEFATVCSLAGLDFEQMKTRVQTALSDPAYFVDFRCAMKRLRPAKIQETRGHYFRRNERGARKRRQRNSHRFALTPLKIRQSKVPGAKIKA
jgi:hypothetical protein